MGYSLATRIPYREEYVNTFIDNFIYVYKGGIPLQKLLYEEESNEEYRKTASEPGKSIL